MNESSRSDGFLTIEQRSELGRAARKRVPRKSLGEFTPQDDVRDPVALLQAEDEGRVEKLIPIKYGRMLTTPLAFYRGAAALMAADLASEPNTGITSQICGDAHLSNFGLFAAPDRRLVFDCNDFDETLPGPWEWDLKRLAASIAIAARSIGAGPPEATAAVLSACAAYRSRMRELAEFSNLDVYHQRVEVEQIIKLLKANNDAATVKQVSKMAEKAYTRDSIREFKKLTHVVDGKRRIISDPPLITPIEEVAKELGIDHSSADIERFVHEILDTYKSRLLADRRHLLDQYEMVDLARKVVGVGSVGTRVWIVLLVGRDENDPLFLQVKEAGPSVLEKYLGPSALEPPGLRVIEGQRLMQGASDPLLGYETIISFDGQQRHFYVRQLKDWKGSAKVEKFTPSQLASYSALCARVLARAHARSGDRIAISSYVGKSNSLDLAIARYADAYADQNDRDYARVREAAEDGRIQVREGI